MVKYLGTQISENMIRDSVGQLICENCIIARDGGQKYLRSELPGWDPKTMKDEVIEIARPWEEVSRPETIASFEAKPVVVRHPDEDVSINNYRDVVVGYSKDVRPGTKKVDGYNVLLATLVIYDPETIEAIESGRLRELSCGYDVDIDLERKIQYAIEGNHIAIVDSGRGQITTIRDSDELVNAKDEKVWTMNDLPEPLRRLIEQDKISVRTFNSVMRAAVTVGKWDELVEDIKRVPNADVWSEDGYFRKWRYVGAGAFKELKPLLSYLTDALPKQPRHSIITLPANDVHHFDNAKELDKLLSENEFVGLVEFVFEGEMIDSLEELPIKYREVLKKHNFEINPEGEITETDFESLLENETELWKVVMQTTESNDPDAETEEVAIHFGPNDAKELSDTLEGLNFSEAEVFAIDGSEVTLDKLPKPIQAVLNKYLS